MLITIDTAQPLTALEAKILREVLDRPGIESWPPADEPQGERIEREFREEAAKPAHIHTDLAGLREIAVAKATELMSTGQEGKDTVRAALAKVGGRKVSELADDQLQAFLDAL